MTRFLEEVEACCYTPLGPQPHTRHEFGARRWEGNNGPPFYAVENRWQNGAELRYVGFRLDNVSPLGSLNDFIKATIREGLPEIDDASLSCVAFLIMNDWATNYRAWHTMKYSAY